MTTAARPLSPSRIVRAKGRDTLLEEELKHMASQVKARGEENALHFGLQRSEAKPCSKGTSEKRSLDSKIFGPGKTEPVPPMRLRPDYDESELKKIYPGADQSKAQAADKMATSDTMLDKMYSANYPIPRKNEQPARGKKSVQEPQVVGSPVASNMVVEGFSGMGMKSEIGPRSGISMHAKDIEAVKPIPTAGGVLKRHTHNTLTGQAPGVSLPGQYETSAHASYQPY